MSKLQGRCPICKEHESLQDMIRGYHKCPPEFDKLVRSEMKRLAPVPGTMPGHALWNELRDPQLPTMGGVVSRYDCTDLKGLAELLNLNPPISKPGPVGKQ